MYFIFHTVGHNERWDMIAYKYYSNCYNIQPIIEANPHVALGAILKEGAVLKIPIEENSKNNNSFLPVWKRVDETE